VACELPERLMSKGHARTLRLAHWQYGIEQQGKRSQECM